MIRTGGRTAAEIVNWLKKRTGPPATELTTVEDARAFTKKDDVVVVGFFKDRESDAANAFISAADTQDSVTFGITSVKEVADALDAKFDSIVLFKQVCVCGCVGVEVWGVLCVCREGGFVLGKKSSVFGCVGLVWVCCVSLKHLDEIKVDSSSLLLHPSHHSSSFPIPPYFLLPSPFLPLPLTQFDSGRAVFSGEYTTEEIVNFVLTEQLPLVTKFSDEVRRSHPLHTLCILVYPCILSVYSCILSPEGLFSH